MQKSTQIKDPRLDEIAQRIKDKDTEALLLAQSAQADALKAARFVQAIAADLDQVSDIVGRNNSRRWIEATFGSDAAPRFARYKKAASDKRQQVLSLGIVPESEKEKAPQLSIVKPPAHINWLNKLTGHLRKCDRLTDAEMTSFRQLVSELDRLGVPPIKESLSA